MDTHTARPRIASMERSRHDHDRSRRLPLLAVARQIRRWSLPIIAALAVAAPAVLPGRSDAAVRAPAQPRPTIVLIHGAWADASSWSGVVRRLQRDGYTVDAPPNQLRSLTGDAAYVSAFLSTIPGPIVLVGHSYGGAVITNAATGNANVKALVYIDAFIPDRSEQTLKLAGAQPGSCLGGDPAKVYNAVQYPGAPKGDVDLYIKPNVFLSCFANGVERQEATSLAATQRPLTLSAAMTPSGAPAWKTIPSWSLIGTADKIIPPAEQRIMSQRAHAHIIEIDAGHLSLVSHPGAVSTVIEQAVHATK